MLSRRCAGLCYVFVCERVCVWLYVFPIHLQPFPHPTQTHAPNSSSLPFPDWSPPELEEEQVDSDSYLVARPAMSRPRREESSEPLLGSPTVPTHAPTITTSHAHNPAYSPTSETPPPPHGHQHGHPPLHYSTLATRPDEEDAHTLVRA